MKQQSLKKISFVRLLRDVLTTTEELCFDRVGNLIKIQLNRADTIVRPWIHSLATLLKLEQITINLGKT